MPQRPQKVPVTNSDVNDSNGELNTVPLRRPPVTDLLFDLPRSSAQNDEDEESPSGSLPEHDRQRAVYYISIVAEMVETHPQTLRMYERIGLITPQRTRNNIRLYSESDIEQVRRIQHLTQELGVNLAGVEVVFKLLREMHRLREEMESEIEAQRQETKRDTRNS